MLPIAVARSFSGGVTQSQVEGVFFPIDNTLYSIALFRLCILNVTHQGAAHDVANVHCRPNITRTDILVCMNIHMILSLF